MPKSAIFTQPRSLEDSFCAKKMFCVLMSRWRTCLSCIYFSARHIWVNHLSTFGSEIVDRCLLRPEMYCHRSPPSQYSIRMHNAFSCTKLSRYLTMYGCLCCMLERELRILTSLSVAFLSLESIRERSISFMTSSFLSRLQLTRTARPKLPEPISRILA